VSLRVRLAILVALLLALAVGMGLTTVPDRLEELGRTWAERRAVTAAEVLASAVAPALDFGDAEAAAEQLQHLGSTPDSLYAVVYREDGSALAGWNAERVPALGPGPVSFTGDAVHVSEPIFAQGGATGTLRVGFSLRELQIEQRQNVGEVLAGSAAVMALGILLSLVGGTVLARPLEAMTGAAGAVARGQLDAAALGLRAGGEQSRDEVARLGAALVTMVEQLQQLERAREQRQRAEREAAEARAASEAKSAFLATMSHELRTPLNGVIGLNDALQRTALDADQREMVEAAGRAGEVLLGLINQVLDLAKVEAGRQTLEATPLDPVQIAAEAAEIGRSQVGRRPVVVALDADLGGRWVLGDPVRLRQILVNLVGNAVKFTQRGEVRVSVGAVEGPDGLALTFAVKDTGIGMEPGQVDRLFKPFEQADSSTTRRFGGTGLGLSIVLSFVELMGGELEVDTAPGRGTTFRVRLTLPQTDERPAGATEEVELPARGAPWRVLVAEDNPVNQLVLRRLLEGDGCAIAFASDGLEALELLTLEPFDLVLMDCQMPRMNGYEAARAVREGRAGDPRVPILALTASALPEDERAALEAGMDGYLTKPIRRAELLRSMAACLSTAAAA
jgi:signal transduction histidine kinase/ActR/RegA family two-component response regulator